MTKTLQVAHNLCAFIRRQSMDAVNIGCRRSQSEKFWLEMISVLERTKHCMICSTTWTWFSALTSSDVLAESYLSDWRGCSSETSFRCGNLWSSTMRTTVFTLEGPNGRKNFFDRCFHLVEECEEQRCFNGTVAAGRSPKINYVSK